MQLHNAISSSSANNGNGNGNGIGNNSNNASSSRTAERALDEAQATGELNIAGRSLKHFPASNKHNLIDLSRAGKVEVGVATVISLFWLALLLLHASLSFDCLLA